MMGIAPSVPFDRFEDFFRASRLLRGGGSLGRFFPGAFTYHWHNLWSAPVETGSPFARLAGELDAILYERLGIEALTLSTTRRRRVRLRVPAIGAR